MTELKSLDFSNTQILYRSLAICKNNNGQEFIIRVESSERVALEQFTRNFRASFDKVTEEISQPLQEASIFSKKEPEVPLSQLELDKEITETLPNYSLKIFVEVPKKTKLQQPKMLNYRFFSTIDRSSENGATQRFIDNNIENGATQRLREPHIYVIGRKPTVTVNVISGTIKVKVFKNEGNSPVAQGIFSEGANSALIIDDFPIGTNDIFSIEVTGQGNTESKYTINGSWTVG